MDWEAGEITEEVNLKDLKPGDRVGVRSGEGVEELVAAMERHRGLLQQGGALRDARREQAVTWGLRRLREEFGRFGVEQIGDVDAAQQRWRATSSIFAALEETRREILAGWSAKRAPGGES